MPIEITLLGWSIVLLVLQIFLQGGLSTFELGREYNASPRDEGRRPNNVYAGRAERALRNLLETYPAFVALALALVVAGKNGGTGALGAQVWFWARVAYVPLYLAGVPYVRSFAWLASIAGLAMMLFRLLG